MPRPTVLTPLALRMHKARKGTGLSQERFAERVQEAYARRKGVALKTLEPRRRHPSRHDVLRWEAAKNVPRPAMLAAIAETAGVTVEWLLDGDEEDEEAALQRVVEEFVGILVDRVRAAASAAAEHNERDRV